jgi:beta-lactamase class A
MADWNSVAESVQRWSGEGEIGVSIKTLAGEHWEYQADRRFVAASTIKIPVMITLYRQIDQGLHAADELIALGPDRIPGSGVLQHMHEGLELTVDDLCTLMIAISDNTATNMLVDLVGLDQVNRTIHDLGMANSVMGRKMLGRRATSDDGENWVTAADLTKSVHQILDGRAASTDSCRAMKTMLTRQDQSRKVTRFAPEGSVWGSKTGGLPGIVNDAGFIETDRGAVVISMCCEGFARDDQADLAIAEISLAALKALRFVD